MCRADQPRTRAPQLPPTILVADGDPAILELVEELLTDAGFVVVAVTSAMAAVRALARGSFAVVVTDPFVFGTYSADNSWATLSSIRAVAGATPLVIFSAHNTGAFADFAACGFAAVIHKPFDLDVFCAVIQTTIANTQRLSRSTVVQSMPLCDPQHAR